MPDRKYDPAKRRQRYLQHQEREKARRRKYYEDHKPEERERSRQYYLDHRDEIIKRVTQNRKAKQAQGEAQDEAQAS